MKNDSSRQLIKIARAKGWILEGAQGSHHHFYHPKKTEKLTIPHPRKNFKIKTLKSILEILEET